MTPLEKDIEKHLRREVGRRGGLCLKWVCPGWSGVPDRIILMPGGRIYFVELKRSENARIGRNQIEWHQRLRSLGFHSFFLKSHEDVQQFAATLDTSYTGFAFRESAELEVNNATE